MITVERARKIREVMEGLAATLEDDIAYEVPEMFPRWTIKDYAVGDRVRYDDKLWKCLIAHTSQDSWLPNISPSLWVEVAEPGTIPEWKQPVGSTDSYMTGDKVRHNDFVWVSDVDYNIWEPGVYGWSIV